MKNMFIVLLATGMLISCNQGTTKKDDKAMNPLLEEAYGTKFEIPVFDKITPAHYVEAVDKGIAEQKANVEKIIKNTEEPTFENTVVALDNSGLLLGKVLSVFYSQSGVDATDEMMAVETKISPKLSAHGDEISLNPELFKRIKAVYEKKDELNLNEEQAFILENLYKGYVRNGANLPAEKQEELKKINARLSELAVKFGQNLINEDKQFTMVIDNKADLAGLPEGVVSAAAEAAKARKLEGKWVFTTSKPSMIPFLQYADKRELRQKLHTAYLNRGNNNNEYDNKKIVAEVVKLRAERAALLGYKTHAHVNLEPRMAGTPDRALALLNKLWDAALPIAKSEAKELQKMIDAEGGKFKLESWDWWYYTEKLRKAKYNLDENEIRPYFELKNVEAGAFAVATKLYGITFTKLNDVPVPTSEATAYEVKEADGSHLGILFCDWHPRATKSQGAWCGSYRDHRIMNGEEISPLVTIVGNFTRPTGDTPALLSMDEVETLFHEFGHALDGLFSKTSYGKSYIAWDFVELPSQIMEHWATETDVLKMYAKHYKTGEVIPQELIEKMSKASKFNQGFATTEYLAASLLDLQYHTMTEPKEVDVEKFEKDFLKSKDLIPQIHSRYRTTYFGHIIGGYDAGYYSYIWAGVLDNDAYDAFKEKGIFNKEVAESFRKNILEKNGIENAMKMFVDFRGREPKEEALLRNRGLL